MNHQYITTSRLKKNIHFLTDCAVDIYVKFFGKVEKINIKNPKKILFFSLGHLGDALILSYIFPLIRESFPNTSIDVVVPEWSEGILKSNPFIRRIIVHNTYHENRIKKNIFSKIRLQYTSIKRVIAELKKEGYDISIEGRISYPNGNRIAYKSKVKQRVGFGSGGFGSLLTNEIKFPQNSSFHILEAVLKELEVIGVTNRLNNIKPYYYYDIKTEFMFQSHIDSLLSPFIVLHFETGNRNRSVNQDFLIKIVKKIIEETKFYMVLCGISKESNEFYDRLLNSIADCNNRITNSVNKYSLDELFLLSKFAKAAITLESLPAHLCAINCSTISLYNNGAGALFFPISNKTATVIHNNYYSRDSYIRQNITNYYVKKIDSEETLKTISSILQELIKN